MRTFSGSTGSMSLLDHLPLGANVDGSGSSTQPDGCTQLESFAMVGVGTEGTMSGSVHSFNGRPTRETLSFNI